MEDEARAYTRPRPDLQLGTIVTKDDRVLHIGVPEEQRNRERWSLLSEVKIPAIFFVTEFVPSDDPRLCVEYEYRAASEPANVCLRSVLVTGLGGEIPLAEDFRALRPEDNRARALDYFDRALWSAGLPMIGLDLGGESPNARAFPSSRRGRAANLDDVAREYEAALADPDRTDTPASVVASALKVSEATASRRIREARLAGKITSEPTRGRRPRA